MKFHFVAAISPCLLSFDAVMAYSPTSGVGPASLRKPAFWTGLPPLGRSGRNNGGSGGVEPQEKKKNRTFLQAVDRVLTKLQNPEESLRNHIYLSDDYAPVHELLIDEPVEVVEGAIPHDIEGMFCRNGPNPVHQNRLYHWFDGDAMLHNLRFEKGGNVFYTNQYVPSIRHQIEEDLGEDLFHGLGEYKGFIGLAKLSVGESLVKPFFEGREDDDEHDLISSPPNTACLMYRNKFYCLNEANIPLECRILPDGRLEKVGYESFGGVLDYPVSAHPRIDENGDLLFHSYSVLEDKKKRDGPMKIGTYSAEKDRVETYFSPVPDQDHVSFAHNLMFSENYLIIYDCSVHFDPKSMLEGGSFFKTDPKYNFRFGIMPKKATNANEVVWFDIGGPGGIVHPLNSWEEDDGTIVIWTPFCENLVVDMESEDINRFCMMEFRLNPATGQIISKEVIDDSVNVEFSVAPAMGRFVRYGYTAIQDPSTPGEGSFTGFCIWDMKERKLARKVYYDGLGGEPAVITTPDGEVSYVGAYVQKNGCSYFDLYDGETTERVARLKMPGRVPYGFHGLWINGQELHDHFDFHSSQQDKEGSSGIEIERRILEDLVKKDAGNPLVGVFEAETSALKGKHANKFDKFVKKESKNPLVGLFRKPVALAAKATQETKKLDGVVKIHMHSLFSKQAALAANAQPEITK